MMVKRASYRLSIYEVIFQVLLHAMVFVFYAFDHRCSHGAAQVELSEVVIFMNYVVAAAVINYFLLPKYLYKQKYWHFGVYVLVIVASVIFIEEAVLEKIFYPTTKGTNFPGIFFNLTDAMPTITILAGFKFAWDALTKQREVELLQMAVKESELQFLKSQINPHFLFNNLNNLYAHALEQSPQTPDIILELSGVLRYMLYECMDEYVPLPNEIAQLENFVNLSKLQFEGRGEVSFTSGNIRAHDKIAPLILSVFVENAFKHSGSSQSDNIQIAIHIEQNEEGFLFFTCENTFSIESNTSDLSKGIGLENVKKRLKLIYPNAHTLHIGVIENRYKVELKIDLKD